jgi:hypothetical protein
MSFPFLKALSGAAGVVGKFLRLLVVVLGDASFEASSKVWRLLHKLWSGGGCCSLFADLPVAPSFISVCVLWMVMWVSGGCGMVYGVVAHLGLSYELWVDSSMVCSWGNLFAFQRCGALQSRARGMGSLFRVRDREWVSFRSCDKDASSVSVDDAPCCPCFPWCRRSRRRWPRRVK